MAEAFRTLHPVKYYRDHISNGSRPDGRKFETFRPVIINIGSIQTADGSALAKVGDTIVMCGIKAELCSPKPDNPKEGFLIPNVELPPLCSPRFKSGPPSDEAQVATQFLSDIIRNSKCIDLKDLCLFPEKLAWCLFADLICISHDGSLMDACVLALIGALRSVKLPSVEFDPTLNSKSVNEDEKSPLNILDIPVCSTFSIFEEKTLMYDPTDEEESLCSSVFNIVVTKEKLCSVHKLGGSSIQDADLFHCMEMSKHRATKIRDLINAALKTSK